MNSEQRLSRIADPLRRLGSLEVDHRRANRLSVHRYPHRSRQPSLLPFSPPAKEIPQNWQASPEKDHDTQETQKCLSGAVITG